MEGVSGPVGHVIEELVVFEDDEGILVRIVQTVAEVWVFDVNGTTSRSNVPREHIISEHNGTSVASNKEW